MFMLLWTAGVSSSSGLPPPIWSCLSVGATGIEKARRRSSTLYLNSLSKLSLRIAVIILPQITLTKRLW